MSASNETPCDFINSEQKQAIVNALIKSYSTAQSKFNEDDGDNSHIFGYGLHFYTKKNFKDVFVAGARVEDQDVKIYDGLTFRMHINGRVLASYRVGKYASQDIAKCFPHNSNTAPKLAEENAMPVLPNLETGATIFESDDENEGYVKNWVIAHLGNPESGLEAAYICAPGEVQNDKISSWKHVSQIYFKSADQEFISEEQQQLHPEVEVPDFVVTRKRDKTKIEMV